MPQALKDAAELDAVEAAEVFLSFSSTDREIALKVEAAIEAMGMRCWSFITDQEAGSYAAHIAEAITDCRVVVLILSEAACASEDVKREIALANERNRPIVPFSLDQGLMPSGDLAYRITGLQRAASREELERLLQPFRSQKTPLPLPIDPVPLPRRGIRWWGYVLMSLSVIGFLVVMSQVFCTPGAQGAPAADATRPLLSDAELATILGGSAPPVDTDAVAAALGPAASVLQAREHIDLGLLRTTSDQSAGCIMQRAVDRGLSLAELFTDPLFGRGGKLAVVLDRSQLAWMNRVFDLHSLFPPAAVDDDGNPMVMQFLLAGQGRLVVGYDHGGEFEHREPAYHLYGGRYDLAPIIAMDLQVGEPRTFTRIHTLASLAADAPAEDFVGPRNAKLQRLVIGPEGIVVKAELPWYLLKLARDLKVKAPPIERRSLLAAADARALNGGRCPIESTGPGPAQSATGPGP